MTCHCGSRFFTLLGTLGPRTHYRCRYCGLDWSRVARRPKPRVPDIVRNESYDEGGEG